MYKLLCWMCFLTFFFSEGNVLRGQDSVSRGHYKLVFWNVENLFDIENDPEKGDDAFTPRGDNHWTRKRYEKKKRDISRVLAATGSRDGGLLEMPVIVGLAEVENDNVLRELCAGTALRRFGYQFVHYESPDTRGIDCALLYREGKYRPFYTQSIDVSDSSIELETRDILLVEGVLKGGSATLFQNTEQEEDSLIVLVCHLPSKRGGTAADIKRAHVARKLREVLDTLRLAHPNAGIVAMGDFNASPDEEELKSLMGGGYVDLMSNLEPGRGSHYYQGKWAYLDQIIVTEEMINGKSQLQVDGVQVFAPEFMMEEDERHLVKKPLRTFMGMRYLGGYSDHLPVGVELKGYGL